MDDENGKINYRNYYGDSRKRHRIVFERGTPMGCVFCGGSADTREHIPSRVLLEKPYPENLATIPSCYHCNNSYSSDELYSSLLIEFLKADFYPRTYKHSEETLRRIVRSAESQQAVDTIKEYDPQKKYHLKDERLENVLVKLAICHATHDTSDCYEGSQMQISQLDYSFRPTMSQDEIEDMDSVEFLDGKSLPEVGSFGYEHIYVMNLPVINPATGEQVVIEGHDGQPLLNGLAFIDWNDVQQDRYRYICFLQGDQIHVKIAIAEFLFVHTVFEPES